MSSKGILPAVLRWSQSRFFFEDPAEVVGVRVTGLGCNAADIQVGLGKKPAAEVDALQDEIFVGRHPGMPMKSSAQGSGADMF